ncbi:chondroitin sulfate synthase 2-like [Babylonia areolata]|uniref:chondroitin sulfate synthase 2-like n=1 Tax=Babylonia areolata TaxID=304850 RepID=UPI003FCFCCD2
MPQMDTKCMRWAKVLMPAALGLFLGMALSLMYVPFSASSCETFLFHQDPQERVHRAPKSLKPNPAKESFEPRIRPPQQTGKGGSNTAGAKSTFVRPRYASTELAIREKLFVGVVTSKDTINTLGVAVNRTVGKFVNKMVFFIDGNAPTMPKGMTIVKMADNHAHLIPVHMLKYVTDQFLDAFDYYLFLTDQAYLRAERMFHLLSHISVSQHVHMGLTKGSEAGKPYCYLDGGVVLSQSLIQQVKANMEWCLAECHHNDQSLNLGKCLVHSTKMGCSSHVGVKEFNVFKDTSFTFENLKKLSKVPAFNQSHSVFPIQDDKNYYKLHRYFCEYDLNVTRQEIEKEKKNIMYMSQFAPGGQDSISWPIGVPEPYKPRNRFDIIRWDYFTETLIYFENDFTNLKPLKGADKQDVQEVIKVSLEQLNARYDNRYLYVSLVNGYRRFDPQRGMEYILDLSLKDTVNHKKEVQKRVQLVRPLGKVEVIPMPYMTETTSIHLVLPVMEEDKEGVGTFLDTYAHICLDAQENTELLVIFMYSHVPMPGQEDSFSVLKSMIAYYNKKYAESASKIEWVAMQTNGSYVSDFQMMDVVSGKFPPESLILLCSVGMELITDFFNRIRMNTITEWQVFFPIGFWQYKPNLIYDKKPYPTSIDLNNKVGHYDMLSFEHCSFYLSDFLQARQLVLPDDLLNGDLFEMFVKYSKLHVFRAVEPALKHRFKNFSCQGSMPPKHQERCLDRRSHSLATRAQLAKLIFELQEKSNPAIKPKKV